MALLDIDPRDDKFARHFQDLRSCRDNMIHAVEAIEALKTRLQGKIQEGIPNDTDLTDDDKTSLLAQARRLRDKFIENLNSQLGN